MRHAQLRNVPAAGGGCHSPDYVAASEFATILCPDVKGSHRVPVALPSALFVDTVEDSPGRRAHPAMPTDWTRAGTVVLFLERDAHSGLLCLVCEFVPDAAKAPLMQLLVVGGANIEIVTDVSHIANHQPLDSLFSQGVDQVAGEFVFDISDLALDFLQVFLFGFDQFLATLTSLLGGGDQLIEPLDELVLVLPQRTQVAAIHQVAVLPVVGDCRVDFTGINACHALLFAPLLVWFVFLLWQIRAVGLVGGNCLVPGPCPVDHDRFGKAPFPGDAERRSATTVGKDEEALLEADGARLEFDLEVPLAAVRRSSVPIGLPEFSPGREGREKRLDRGIDSMGVQEAVAIFGDEAHERFRLEPDPLVAHSSPEEDERSAIDFPCGVGKRVQVRCFANVDTPDQIHLLLPSFLSILLQRYESGKANAIALRVRLTGRFGKTAACSQFTMSIWGSWLRGLYWRISGF
jgi:hypothetical protein